MPKAHFQGPTIAGIAVTTGPELRRADDDAKLFGGTPEQFEKIKKTIGLNERWVAPPGITAADLCEDAARELMMGMGVNAEELDAIVCVTQTPDHFQPCNAAILHGRLGLGKHAAAFDINLGCSGWVVGLYVAFLMVQGGGCEKVLLLAGDTLSQCVNPRDRSVAALFGDAGSATLVVRGESESWFSLHTNGKGADFIQIPAGGFRKRPSAETRAEVQDESGNLRSEEDLCLNGAEVFNASLLEEPQSLKDIFEFSQVFINEVDWFVFNQSNKFTISTIAKKLKIPFEKVPMKTLELYGNQSSASIPSAICVELAEEVKSKNTNLLFSGFGVGLSWATCLYKSEGFRFLSLRKFGHSLQNRFPNI